MRHDSLRSALLDARTVWFAPALLALVASGVAAADLQVVVRGPDGEPAVGALVTADPLGGAHRASALTGEDGTARFEGAADGRYLVAARSDDLSAAPIEVTVERNRSANVELRLRFAAVRESVVVSAALGARREEESTVLVDVLSAESLADRDEWFLLEGLRGRAGAHVYQTGSQGQQVALRFRGLPAEATAVVVDGAPIRDAAAPQSDAVSLLPSLSVLGVDRVEIRRGGGSTIYGSNGMGGVLQIVTRSVSGPDALRIRAGVGQRGHSRAGGEAGVGGPRLGAFVGFSRLAVSEGADGDDPFTNHTGIARARLQLNDAVRLTARSLFSVAAVGLNESPFPLGSLTGGITPAVPAPEAAIRGYEAGTPLDQLDLGGGTFMPSLNDPDHRQETRFTSTLAALRGSHGPDLAWTLRLHELRTRRENEDGPGGVNPFDPPEPAPLIHAGGVRSVAARTEVSRGAVRFVVGGEFEAERAETTDPGYRTELRQTGAAAFVQAEGRSPGGRGNVRGAIRGQHFRTDLPTLSPVDGSPWRDAAPPPSAGAVTGEASASFAVVPALRLRVSAGRGFRAPSLYERFGTWYGAFGYSVFGDPRLLPEYTSVADAGFAIQSPDGRHEARGAFFRSERSRIIAFGALDFGSDPFGRFSGYENTAGGIARGVEVSWRAALPLRSPGRTSTTPSRTPIRRPMLLTNSNPTGSRPRHRGGALVSGAVGDRFRWAADLMLSSAIHAPLVRPGHLRLPSVPVRGDAPAGSGALLRGDRQD